MTIEFLAVEPADPIARDLHRVIDACTFMCDRGPVIPPVAPHPFVDDAVPVPTVHGRALGAGGHRDTPAVVLAMLRAAGDDGLTCREVSERLTLVAHGASQVLNKLQRAGKVVRKGPAGHMDALWLLADVVAEAA